MQEALCNRVSSYYLGAGTFPLSAWGQGNAESKATVLSDRGQCHFGFKPGTLRDSKGQRHVMSPSPLHQGIWRAGGRGCIPPHGRDAAFHVSEHLCLLDPRVLLSQTHVVC